jgi:hypothetical protein
VVDDDFFFIILAKGTMIDEKEAELRKTEKTTYLVSVQSHDDHQTRYVLSVGIPRECLRVATTMQVLARRGPSAGEVSLLALDDSLRRPALEAAGEPPLRPETATDPSVATVRFMAEYDSKSVWRGAILSAGSRLRIALGKLGVAEKRCSAAVLGQRRRPYLDVLEAVRFPVMQRRSIGRPL